MLAIYTDFFCATPSFPMQSVVTTETATTHGTGRDKAPSLRKTITSIKILFILSLLFEGCKMLVCHSLIANNVNSAFRREMLLVMPIWTPWTMQVLLKACLCAALGLETAPQWGLNGAWKNWDRISYRLQIFFYSLGGTCFDFSTGAK